jgi:CarD family transcriptional regulator
MRRLNPRFAAVATPLMSRPAPSLGRKNALNGDVVRPQSVAASVPSAVLARALALGAQATGPSKRTGAIAHFAAPKAGANAKAPVKKSGDAKTATTKSTVSKPAAKAGDKTSPKPTAKTTTTKPKPSAKTTAVAAKSSVKKAAATETDAKSTTATGKSVRPPESTTAVDTAASDTASAKSSKSVGARESTAKLPTDRPSKLIPTAAASVKAIPAVIPAAKSSKVLAAKSGAKLPVSEPSTRVLAAKSAIAPAAPQSSADVRAANLKGLENRARIAAKVAASTSFKPLAPPGARGSMPMGRPMPPAPPPGMASSSPAQPQQMAQRPPGPPLLRKHIPLQVASASAGKLTLKMGDNAVHPRHGVGEVVAIEIRDLGGAKGEFYVLRLLDDPTKKIMVPVGATTNAGLRAIMSADEADHVLETMRAKEVAVNEHPWSRRFRAYTEMINSGSPFEVAKVLRDMYRLKFDKDLSFGERRLLDQARSLLMKELALAKRIPESELLAEVAQIFDLPGATVPPPPPAESVPPAASAEAAIDATADASPVA